jgi:hypothetical protein
MFNDGSGNGTCDRTCLSVGYGTNLDGSCRKVNCTVTPPTGWIQSNDIQSCNNFDVNNYTASNLIDKNQYCPALCFLRLKENTNDTQYFNDDINNNADLNNYINSQEDLNNFQSEEEINNN